MKLTLLESNIELENNYNDNIGMKSMDFLKKKRERFIKT